MSDFLLTTLSFICENWCVVVTQGTCYQDQKWLIDISDFRHFKQFLARHWDNGYRITDISTRGEFYSLVLSSGISINDQDYECSKTFPEAWVNEKIQDGYFISGIAGTDEEWCVVCSKMDMVEFDQIWKVQDKFPESWIYRQSREGYKINVLSTGPQGWVVVLNKTQENENGTYQKQDWRTASNPEALLKWGTSESGMKIQAIAGGEDEMTIIRTEIRHHGEQKTTISSTFPESWLKIGDETKGYEIDEEDRLYTVRSSRGESIKAPLLLSRPTEQKNKSTCPCCTIL